MDAKHFVSRSLEQVAETIEKYEKKGNPVAGIIVEPIQSEGGDNEASPEYFQRLQKLCKEVCEKFKLLFTLWSLLI